MNSDLVVGWTVAPLALGLRLFKGTFVCFDRSLYIYKIACLQINDHCRPHRHTGRGSQHHNGLTTALFNTTHGTLHVHEKMRT